MELILLVDSKDCFFWIFLMIFIFLDNPQKILIILKDL
jgi:hypothetical protein